MKKIIQTSFAPAAIGPYSQAVSADLSVGKIVFLSGQIPLDPKTGELVSGDFAARARQVFQNIQAVCEAAGGNLNHIIKLNIYLLSLDNFQIVNQLMIELFSEPYPARATLAVAGLPKGTDVEIEAVMYLF